MGKTISLRNDSKSGFIYLEYKNFQNVNDYYLHFKVFNDQIDLNISYVNTDKDPCNRQYYSSLNQKTSDKYDINSEPKIYSYKIQL